MNEEKYPWCQGPDPDLSLINFDVPKGTIDCHAHIFNPISKYPYFDGRGYTPPDASLETFLDLHKALGGIQRAILT